MNACAPSAFNPGLMGYCTPRGAVALLAGCIAAGWLTAAAASGTGSTQAQVSYEGDIRPILEQHCVSCHGWWLPKSGLRLDSREAILKGGRSGPAVVPGSPEKGWIMHTLGLENGRRLKMPPGDAHLSEREVRLISEWIRQGAN